MKHYLAYWTGGDRSDFQVHSADAAAPLDAFLDGLPNNRSGIVVSEESLPKESSQELVMLHNAAVPADKAIKKFENRDIAIRRVLSALTSIATELPATPQPAPADADVTDNEEDMSTKKTKTKTTKAKTPRVKKPRVPKEKKARQYKAAVVSKGSDASKAQALEMVQRKMGATAEEISAKLEVSLGTAKNLVWYLRRDGQKIIVGQKAESGRRPYVMAE